MTGEPLLEYRDCSVERYLREASCELVDRLDGFGDDLTNKQKIDGFHFGDFGDSSLITKS